MQLSDSTLELTAENQGIFTHSMYTYLKEFPFNCKILSSHLDHELEENTWLLELFAAVLRKKQVISTILANNRIVSNN